MAYARYCERSGCKQRVGLLSRFCDLHEPQHKGTPDDPEVSTSVPGDDRRDTEVQEHRQVP